MSLGAPIFYHYFCHPVPYLKGLLLQESIHRIQLAQRRSLSHQDILLLLQHRPVYTAGRRQTESEVADERRRLEGLGADFVCTERGGQTTFHGPGQIVGYPLLDLSRYQPAMSIRDYICRLQKTMQRHLMDSHWIFPIPSDHTGVFLDPTTKIGSIGVQVRHRLTTHGFALNITKEPLAWFDQVVACGLTNVKAGCIETATGKDVEVRDNIPGLVDKFGKVFEREMLPLALQQESEVKEAVIQMEQLTQESGGWPPSPLLRSSEQPTIIS